MWTCRYWEATPVRDIHIVTSSLEVVFLNFFKEEPSFVGCVHIIKGFYAFPVRAGWKFHLLIDRILWEPVNWPDSSISLPSLSVAGCLFPAHSPPYLLQEAGLLWKLLIPNLWQHSLLLHAAHYLCTNQKTLICCLPRRRLEQLLCQLTRPVCWANLPHGAHPFPFNQTVSPIWAGTKGRPV